MTEIDLTRISTWWNSVRRFLWSGLGLLFAAGGVIRLIRHGERVWGWMMISCFACGTQHRLPLWNRVLLNAILYGYGFLTLAAGCNQFMLPSMPNAPDYMIVAASFLFPWALAMFLVRFSRYESLNSA